jgi:hypothetical protein
MTNFMYTSSVPVFQQMLGSLQTILSKAEEHASAKKIDAAVFLQARLSPDMFPLLRQVQIAADFAKGVSARLANVAVPEYEDTEVSFADLHARLTKTLAFIGSLSEQQFTDSESREIVLRPGTPKEKKMPGQAYLLSYGLPQFFFHATTAYAILRHNGVELGKKDYMGKY